MIECMTNTLSFFLVLLIQSGKVMEIELCKAIVTETQKRREANTTEYP